MTASRQGGEVLLHLALETATRGAVQRTEAEVEAELLVLRADEVEDRQSCLGRGQPETSSKLLQEDRRALGRPEKEHSVDGRQVEALIEEVNGEEDVHFAVAEGSQCRGSFLAGGLRGDGHARNAGSGEALSHVLGVLDAHAKAQ